jgi:hypothetical protein
MEKQLIEVELRDENGNICLSNRHDLSEQLMDQIQTRIDEKIGGLLCFDHVQVPISIFEFSKRRWVVKITCCCGPQLDLVEKRLKENFQ